MVYDLKSYIEGFDPKNIMKGDVIVTKSYGTIKVDKITQHGWDFNYGEIIWFSEDTKGEYGHSVSSKELLQSNERSFRKLNKNLDTQ